uniref:Lon proteolytic domain-containing protein n=1 Tax=Meloidogyne incognita TaxID=6306 RepID=A0A914L349_MELIC
MYFAIIIFEKEIKDTYLSKFSLNFVLRDLWGGTSNSPNLLISLHRQRQAFHWDDISNKNNPLMPVKDFCVESNIYGKGKAEVGRFPVLVSFIKGKQHCSRMEYVHANTSKSHSDDKEVNSIYNENEVISKIYVEKLLRGTIYENEGKITLNFIPPEPINKERDGAMCGMVTAIISKFTNTAPPRDTAIICDLYLGGHLLDVENLRVKIFAARASYIKKLILPMSMKKDWYNMEDALTGGIEASFHMNYKTIVHEIFPMINITKRN